MTGFLKRYWKTLSWVVFISLLSLVRKVPVKPPEIEIVGFDKLAHFVFYFVFSALVYWEGYYSRNKKANLYWVLVFPPLYGGLIELLQMFMVSQRSAEFADFFAGVLGSMLLYFLIIPILRGLKKSRF